MAGKPKFKFCKASAFDFSKAPVYRKTATLKKSQVKIAAKQQEVVTLIKGDEETRNVARIGDFIVTGPQGERYVLKPKQFHALYELDAGKRYRSKGRVRAIILDQNVELIAPWGDRQRTVKGGAVVQRVRHPRDIYLIEETAFRETYAPEKSKPKTRRAPTKR